MFSLRYKQLIVIIAGTLVSIGMYLLVQSLGDFVITKKYLNEVSETKRLSEYQKSFQEYITKRNLTVEDVTEISKWIKVQKYVYVIIYDGNDIIYESGNWNDSYPIYDIPESIMQSPYCGLAIKNNNDNDLNFIEYLGKIKFKEKEYLVSFIDSSESKWYSLLTTLSLMVFFLCLFLFLMLYNRYIIVRIVQLSNEVSLIENGNLEHSIHYIGKDEISLLAKNANNMRNSIVARHKSEKDAWDANSELITSMSHDIRTPLTSIIGYLEILDSKSYQSQEQFEKYIRSCKEKSIQLKDLSDKLFQYFLVFGKESIIMELNTFDVQILFGQLLYEYLFELNNLGFEVESELDDHQSCIITADILYLKRLFDNLFSNIKKYGDPHGLIKFVGTIHGNDLIITIENEIRKDSVLLDSTNIGLKTCKKIVEQMNGVFEIDNDESQFKVRIIFPVKQNKKEQ